VQAWPVPFITFRMHKLLLAEPRIGSYSAFLLFGLLGGYLITRWRATRAGVKGSHIDNLILLISVLSLFGARLFSWLFYFPPGISLWQALKDSSGGMVFYGGLIFGILTVLVYARLARLPLRNLLDVFAPGLALGLALGRVGCFMAGCCWGDLCLDPGEASKLSATGSAWQVRTIPFMSKADFPLAVRFPRDAGAYEQHRKLGLIDEQAKFSLAVHPVQLYESASALALCLFLHVRFEKRQWPGQVFCLLILLYAAIRFAMEFLRADNPPLFAGLTLSQVISLVLGIGATIAAIKMSERRGQPVQDLASGVSEQETIGLVNAGTALDLEPGSLNSERKL
jgi:phosphatidylglycerol---prolipoprotein diacylglyceryl transferase